MMRIIKIITPNKKNALKKNNKNENKKLKLRMRIDNCFFKKYERVYIKQIENLNILCD